MKFKARIFLFPAACCSFFMRRVEVKEDDPVALLLKSGPLDVIYAARFRWFISILSRIVTDLSMRVVESSGMAF